MRCFVLLAVLVVVCVSSTEAAIACNAEFCKNKTCDPNVTQEKCLAKGETGRFLFEERGSQCGCCAQCTGVIKENEDCSELIIFGKHHEKKCVAGTQCNFTERVCKKNP